MPDGSTDAVGCVPSRKGPPRKLRRASLAAFSGRLLIPLLLLPCGQSWAADDLPPSDANAAPASPEPPAGTGETAAGANAAPSPEEREAAAYEAFNRGIELYNQGLFAEALAEFDRAYELSPNYVVLYNIGGANLQLKRWARARRAFELYLKLGGDQVPEQRVSETNMWLEGLKQKTATLTLSMNVAPGEVHIDSTPVEVLELSGLVLDPGEHLLHVSKPGFRPLVRTVHVSDGERVQLVLQLFPEAAPDLRSVPAPRMIAPSAPPPPADRGMDARWVAWGATGALAIGWGTTAALAIKARHDRNTIEHPGTPPERIEDARRLHKTLAIVSDVLLASTLASAGVSAYLTWWADDAPSPATRGSGTAQRKRSATMWRVGISGDF